MSGNKVDIFDKYLKHKIKGTRIFTKFLLNLLLKYFITLLAPVAETRPNTGIYLVSRIPLTN